MKSMNQDSELTQCEQSVYLGGVISDDTNCDEDVTRRIGYSTKSSQRTHGRQMTPANQQKYYYIRRWFEQ